MPIATPLQAVFDRIAAEIALSRRAAKRSFVADAARRYAADSGTRRRTLRRLGITDSHTVIAAARERLELDRLLRQERPFDPPAPVRRWTLLAVWIGERRLRRQARTTAQGFHPLKFPMAAE